MTETEKMMRGMMYDPFTEEMPDMRKRAHDLCREFNKLSENDPRRQTILDELIPENHGVYLQGPIQFDYGCLTTFGEHCYANFNFTVLDDCPITIGNNVFIGPNVSLVTAVHPLLPSERNQFLRADGAWSDLEYAKPIVIEDDCWIASGVTVCGGVTIGRGSVIGAGSVVTHDIPPHSLAYGVPCRAVREITSADSVKARKDLWPEK